jgi:RHS repeat-associated protein
MFEAATRVSSTGKERDSESGLDNFGARFNASSMGRFMSPDPSNLSVDFWLPQTWNRYSYALNNPLAFVDQNGMWPTNIHNQIINEAFPGLSKDQLKTLQQASHDTDYKNQVNGHGPQDVEDSFVHGMSDGAHHQDPTEARQVADSFIAKNESAAEQIQADWVASGQQGVAPNALTAFGNALHTVEDRTSPAHEGEQPWYGSWHWSAVQHVMAERSINQNQMNNSVAAARYAYFRTFGLNWYLLATRSRGACVTTLDSRTGTATTTCSN